VPRGSAVLRISATRGSEAILATLEAGGARSSAVLTRGKDLLVRIEGPEVRFIVRAMAADRALIELEAPEQRVSVTRAGWLFQARALTNPESPREC
jgi:hypothetical protein